MDPFIFLLQFKRCKHIKKNILCCCCGRSRKKFSLTFYFNLKKTMEKHLTGMYLVLQLVCFILWSCASWAINSTELLQSLEPTLWSIYLCLLSYLNIMSLFPWFTGGNSCGYLMYTQIKQTEGGKERIKNTIVLWKKQTNR